MLSKQTIIKKLPELFVSGFEGLDYSFELQSFLSQGLGGVFISRKNLYSATQLFELISHIQSHSRLWIAASQEGSQKQQLKKDFSRIPDLQTVFEYGSPAEAFEVGRIIASELLTVGCNVNFSPTVHYWHQDLELIKKFYGAYIRGHLKEKIIPCIQVLPNESTHPTEKIEAFFQSLIRTKTPMMMASREISALDPGIPESFSHKILTKFLRQDLKYPHLILSCNLSSPAIWSTFQEKSALLALQAGCDLLFTDNLSHLYACLNFLEQAVQDETLSVHQVFKTIEKNQKYKKKYLLHPKNRSIFDLHKTLNTEKSKKFLKKFFSASSLL